MAYAGIQMFMEKLKQLINCNDIPFINNHPEIISERPQFQLLYHDLESMIQTLSFINQQHQEKGNDLMQRFIFAAEEAEYTVDLFLSDVHNWNNGNLPTSVEDFNQRDRDDVKRSFKFVLNLFLSWVYIRKNTSLPNPSLNLDEVWRSFKSIQVELTSMKTERMLIQSASAPVSISTNSQKSPDEIVVGLDHDVELIRDKLVEDHKKVDVVSIVGMGGIGKTTLATKVFNDAYVKHHFHVRVWATVSQTFDKRLVLIQILESIGAHLGLEKASDSRLREMVHKSLMGRRYLIVIDDIWEIEAWDNIKLFFPHDIMGSRIMLTTRLTEVAKHANSIGLIHHLGYLNKERSWELLCQKVFRGNKYPEWTVKPGMRIVKNCKGLPLVVVVIAGVLAKEARNEKFWVEIAYKTGSYIVGEENICLETLGLSYNHLPLRLRECFLYLGGFPEDYKFEVQKLMWLWVAEGFIQEDGNRSLEDIAEGYLRDLIDRNLVIVAHKSRSSGAIKSCKVHDLVRELCLKKAREERFILQTQRLILFSNVITPPYKPVRKFINAYNPNLSHPSTQNIRSILWLRYFRLSSDGIEKYIRSFVLLRVLDIQSCKLDDFPKGMELLVHLRYLAVHISSADFPSSICNLWNLQTLIYESGSSDVVLPSNISDLVNLRHLQSSKLHFDIGSIEKPMHLQTISCVGLTDEAFSFQKYFPCIKKLSCVTNSYKQNDFKSFAYLERLTLWSSPVHGKNQITLPVTLKAVTLGGCCLPWSDMSIIQSLPNLQVLKLDYNAFVGSCWNTDGQEFPQLKFLRLERLNINQWEAYSPSFPCLKQLEILICFNLEEIPIEIGDIPTLELIKIKKCRHSVDESVRRIQQEQQDMTGNYDLKIEVIPSKYHVV
ncbi:putative late blight resistance protein homolog R1A-3 [Bidens hawaiensis]|uniref:putative late blight resistance protein homolog R1A-3 n=1 Tax=Bidens hawaiensis TaxID=980011 RepID=UPI00404AE78E